MSHFYTKISFILKTGEKGKAFFKQKLDEMDEFAPCAYEIIDQGVHLYNDENANLDDLAELVQAYLQKFDPEGHVAIEWANTSDKLGDGVFGGGTVLVTADDMHWLPSGRLRSPQDALSIAAELLGVDVGLLNRLDEIAGHAVAALQETDSAEEVAFREWLERVTPIGSASSSFETLLVAIEGDTGIFVNNTLIDVIPADGRGTHIKNPIMFFSNLAIAAGSATSYSFEQIKLTPEDLEKAGLTWEGWEWIDLGDLLDQGKFPIVSTLPQLREDLQV